MKDLTKFEVTMTSLEIAEYTDKRHDNILADINTMLIGLHGITGHLLFQDTYVTKGKSYKCYRLPKKEVICLISGYSVKLRMAIINRLEELEGKAPTAPKINAPTTTEQLKEDITMLEMIGDVSGSTPEETYLLKKGLFTKYGLSVDMLLEPVEPKKEDVAIAGMAAELLKKINADIGIRAFNKRMVAKGFLTCDDTTTDSNVFVRRKELTDDGLTYGFMKGGSPRYFKSKFKRLYSQLI